MEWINTKDRLPKFNELVITIYESSDKSGRKVSVHKLTKITQTFSGTQLDWHGQDSSGNLDVVFWMALPELPSAVA